MGAHRKRPPQRLEAAIAIDLLLLCVGGTVLVLSLLAGYIVNRLWVSEVTICLALGAAIGPLLSYVARAELFGGDRYATLEEVARLTLGIAVMGVALRLPGRFVKTHWRDLFIVLVIGLPLMWLTSAGLAALILGLPLVPALLAGAIVAPTDPVVAQSVVTGRVADERVPPDVRHLVSAESAANDGLGQLFVMLPILLLTRASGGAWGEWLTHVLLWEVGVAVAMGALAGWIAGKLFLWARARPFSEDQSMLTIALALSLAVLAGVRLIGSDGILAVFVAGVLFNRAITDRDTNQKSFQGAITRFFDLPVFILIGVLLPWAGWWTLGWPGIAFAAALLLVRRLPWWLLLAPLVGTFQRRNEVLFAGWFGPIGVAAAYYAMTAHRDTGLEWLWPVTSLAIAASVVVHGITATPLAHRLGPREKKG